MAKFLRLFGAFILGLLVLIIITPYFISLEDYRNDLVKQASTQLGREVSVGEDVTFRILPRPFIKLNDVRIKSPENITAEDLAHIQNAEVVLSLAALFKGQVEIVQLKLEDPKITLVQKSKADNNWTFAAASAKDPKRKEGDAIKAPAPLPFEIQNIQISDGELRYITQDQAVTVEDIDLKVTLASLQGPFELEADFDYDDENFAVQGTVAKIGDSIPLNLNLKAFKTSGQLKGDLKLAPFTFEGDITLSGNLNHHKNLLKSIDLPKALSDDYSLTALVSLSPETLKATSLTLKVGDLNAQGTASYGLATKSGALDLKLSPGDVHLVIAQTSQSTSKFMGRVTLKSERLEDIINVLDIDDSKISDMLSGQLNVSSTLNITNSKASFSNLNFKLGKTSLSGNFSVTDFSEPQLSYDLKTNSAGQFAKLFDLPLLTSVGRFETRGETILSNKEKLSTNTVLKAAGATLQIIGFIDMSDHDSFKPALDISVSGKSLSSTLSTLGIKGSGALGAFDIKTALQGNIPQDLKATLGSSSLFVGREKLNFSGDIALNLTGSKPRLTLTAQLGQINLDRLMASLESTNNPDGKLIQVSATNARSNQQNDPAVWSNELIDLGFLKMFDGDITLSSPGLQKGSLRFQNALFQSTVTNGVLEISTLKSDLFEGQVNCKGRVSAQKNQSLAFTAQISNAQINNIAEQKGQIKIVGGLLNGSLDITTSGRTQRQFIQNLNGPVNLSVTNGVIAGFDVQKAVNQLSRVNNVGSALRLLTTSFSGGRTQFQALNAKINFKNGVGSLDEIIFDGTGADITVDGVIDLPNYTLDLPMVITFESDPPFPPISVRVFGPIDDPKRKIDAKNLMNHLTKNVFSKVIESIQKDGLKPETLLRDFLGGRSGQSQQNQGGSPSEPDSSNSSPQQPQQRRDIKPEEAVKSILRGLF